MVYNVAILSENGLNNEEYRVFGVIILYNFSLSLKYQNKPCLLKP